MVRERRQAHVVVHVQPHHLLGEALRRVLFPLVREGLRLIAQISVKHAVVSPLPGGAQFLVRVQNHGVHVCLQDGLQLSERVRLLAVVQSLVHLHRHDSVVLQHVHHVAERASRAEVHRPVHPHVLRRLVAIRLTHHVHRRQIHRVFPHPQHLRLEERDSRPGPAGPCPRLVLYRRGRQSFDVRELIAFRFFHFLRVGSQRHGENEGEHE